MCKSYFFALIFSNASFAVSRTSSSSSFRVWVRGFIALLSPIHERAMVTQRRTSLSSSFRAWINVSIAFFGTSSPIMARALVTPRRMRWLRGTIFFLLLFQLFLTKNHSQSLSRSAEITPLDGPYKDCGCTIVSWVD